MSWCMRHKCRAGGTAASRTEGAACPSRLTSERFVTRILVMSEIRSLADVKAHLSEIIDLVESQHERVVITRNGRPAAVILSPGDLDNLEETLDLLGTPGVLEDIRAAETDIDAGEYLNAAELRARYLTKE